MKDHEQDLIRRAHKDRSAYGRLYTLYRDRVFSYFLKRLGGNREIAQDLTQETFARALGSMDRFTSRDYPYGAYLFTIARNLLVNHYKKKQATPIDEAAMHPDLKTPSPEEEYRAKEAWRAVARLGEREKRVLYLKYKKGRTTREIAREMGTSENAVKLVLSRARKKLKRVL